MTFHDHCPNIVKIRDLFMTIQASDSDSGLFRFIHDCGNPEYEQNLSMRAISMTINLMFRLIVLIINKNKDAHHKC